MTTPKPFPLFPGTAFSPQKPVQLFQMSLETVYTAGVKKEEYQQPHSVLH